ncbi:unnamed protein product [Amoebophrya sp. A120]|nr:unnamed protein product [Amoebophrya sp. A120]|eukprot:GSA120T00004276001.1
MGNSGSRESGSPVDVEAAMQFCTPHEKQLYEFYRNYYYPDLEKSAIYHAVHAYTQNDVAHKNADVLALSAHEKKKEQEKQQRVGAADWLYGNVEGGARRGNADADSALAARERLLALKKDDRTTAIVDERLKHLQSFLGRAAENQDRLTADIPIFQAPDGARSGGVDAEPNNDPLPTTGTPERDFFSKNLLKACRPTGWLINPAVVAPPRGPPSPTSQKLGTSSSRSGGTTSTPHRRAAVDLSARSQVQSEEIRLAKDDVQPREEQDQSQTYSPLSVMLDDDSAAVLESAKTLQSFNDGPTKVDDLHYLALSLQSCAQFFWPPRAKPCRLQGSIPRNYKSSKTSEQLSALERQWFLESDFDFAVKLDDGKMKNLSRTWDADEAEIPWCGACSRRVDFDDGISVMACVYSFAVINVDGGQGAHSQHYLGLHFCKHVDDPARIQRALLPSVGKKEGGIASPNSKRAAPQEDAIAATSPAKVNTRVSARTPSQSQHAVEDLVETLRDAADPLRDFIQTRNDVSLLTTFSMFSRYCHRHIIVKLDSMLAENLSSNNDKLGYLARLFPLVKIQHLKEAISASSTMPVVTSLLLQEEVDHASLYFQTAAEQNEFRAKNRADSNLRQFLFRGRLNSVDRDEQVEFLQGKIDQLNFAKETSTRNRLPLDLNQHGFKSGSEEKKVLRWCQQEYSHIPVKRLRQILKEFNYCLVCKDWDLEPIFEAENLSFLRKRKTEVLEEREAANNNFFTIMGRMLFGGDPESELVDGQDDAAPDAAPASTTARMDSATTSSSSASPSFAREDQSRNSPGGETEMTVRRRTNAVVSASGGRSKSSTSSSCLPGSASAAASSSRNYNNSSTIKPSYSTSPSKSDNLTNAQRQANERLRNAPPELQRKWRAKQLEEDKSAALELDRKLNFEGEARHRKSSDENFWTCGFCFDDELTASDCITCTEGTHVYCKPCVKKYIQQLVSGEYGTKIIQRNAAAQRLLCPQAGEEFSDCPGCFTLDSLQSLEELDAAGDDTSPTRGPSSPRSPDRHARPAQGEADHANEDPVAFLFPPDAATPPTAVDVSTRRPDTRTTTKKSEKLKFTVLSSASHSLKTNNSIRQLQNWWQRLHLLQANKSRKQQSVHRRQYFQKIMKQVKDVVRKDHLNIDAEEMRFFWSTFSFACNLFVRTCRLGASWAVVQRGLKYLLRQLRHLRARLLQLCNNLEERLHARFPLLIEIGDALANARARRAARREMNNALRHREGGQPDVAQAGAPAAAPPPETTPTAPGSASSSIDALSLFCEEVLPPPELSNVHSCPFCGHQAVPPAPVANLVYQDVLTNWDFFKYTVPFLLAVYLTVYLLVYIPPFSFLAHRTWYLFYDILVCYLLCGYFLALPGRLWSGFVYPIFSTVFRLMRFVLWTSWIATEESSSSPGWSYVGERIQQGAMLYDQDTTGTTRGPDDIQLLSASKVRAGAYHAQLLEDLNENAYRLTKETMPGNQSVKLSLDDHQEPHSDGGNYQIFDLFSTLNALLTAHHTRVSATWAKIRDFVALPYDLFCSFVLEVVYFFGFCVWLVFVFYSIAAFIYLFYIYIPQLWHTLAKYFLPPEKRAKVHYFTARLSHDLRSNLPVLGDFENNALLSNTGWNMNLTAVSGQQSSQNTAAGGPQTEGGAAEDTARVYPVNLRCTNPNCGMLICNLCNQEAHYFPVFHEIGSTATGSGTASSSSSSSATTPSSRLDCVLPFLDRIKVPNLEALLHYMQEEMSRQKMRRCVDCGLPITLGDGCNKIRCPDCHVAMCYVCNSKVTGYDHFCQHVWDPSWTKCNKCNKCHLYKNNDEALVKRAGASALDLFVRKFSSQKYTSVGGGARLRDRLIQQNGGRSSLKVTFGNDLTFRL